MRNKYNNQGKPGKADRRHIAGFTAGAAMEIPDENHLVPQTNTGQWAEKHGYGGASVLWDVGMTPDTIPWTLGGVPYYDSEIIYYAVGN